MRFQITIKHHWRNLKFTIERMNVTDRSEQFKIVARNKTVVLESNRPMYRNKGLKKRKPDFKVVEGNLNGSGFEQLVVAIMEVVEPTQNKPF